MHETLIEWLAGLHLSGLALLLQFGTLVCQCRLLGLTKGNEGMFVRFFQEFFRDFPVVNEARGHLPLITNVANVFFVGMNTTSSLLLGGAMHRHFALESC